MPTSHGSMSPTGRQPFGTFCLSNHAINPATCYCLVDGD
jgi:hypothetical protein